MARRRKGIPVHGWLVLDKPAGVSSAQAVAKARWALGALKAGHAGTLDPMATGVLVIAFGEATKAVGIVQDGLKTYRFAMRLGQQTASDDAEGAVIETSDARPTDAEIAAALAPYRGQISQVPPQVSAVKVAGARAYDLARDGVEMDLAARPLWVERLDLVARPDADHAELELVCGKGGYVRSIARDLGRDLGCLAHVSVLRRVSSGPFTEAEAIGFDALDAVREGAPAPLRPLSDGLATLPEIRLAAEAAARLRNGQAAPAPGVSLGYGARAWASHAGVPVGLVTVKGGQAHPVRLFIGLDAES